MRSEDEIINRIEWIKNIMRGIYLMGDIMDKEIIIDGVKVEECSYYNKDNTPYCCEVWDNECEAQNCYYKQLKRKERECEKFKKIINEAKNSKLDLKSFLVGEAIQNEYEQQLYQLKQTLIEIKKIAENMNNECFYSDFDCKYCDMKNGCTYLNKKQILQKISEVEY